MVYDLPAGAGRMVQRADGYVETIVAGETVVADGELTDARPGRLDPRPPNGSHTLTPSPFLRRLRR